MYDNEYYKNRDILKHPQMATGQALLEAARIVAAYEGTAQEEVEIRYGLHRCSHYIPVKMDADLKAESCQNQ